MPRKIIFTHHLSPGDVVMMTAAVRDLHLSNPGDFITGVSTSADELWDNNPYITKFQWKDENKKIDANGDIVEVLKCDYPLIHKSNTSPYHFIHGFHKFFEEELKVKCEPTDFKGDIYLSEEEKSWMSKVEELGVKDRFWIIVSGGKYDFTAKWWDPVRFQQIVNHFKDRITFVQCGEAHGQPGSGHWQPSLNGVIDLRGKTDLRQFIRLVYHSVGVICPVTFAMHLAAAVEMKHQPPMNRPCVVIAGGREPSQWEAYPHHQYIHRNGSFSCCDNGGCWVSRCQLVHDGDEKDEKDICKFPVQLNEHFRIPLCMHSITVPEVIARIEAYYAGDCLKYNGEDEQTPPQNPKSSEVITIEDNTILEDDIIPDIIPENDIIVRSLPSGFVEPLRQE